MKYKTYQYESYQIYTVQTNKFKNCYIEVCFRDDIREVQSVKRYLLNRLMTYTTKKYNTRRKRMLATEELYNLYYHGQESRLGYNLFTTFSIDFLHPKFVKEKDYFDKCLEFLFEAIQNPNVENGLFDQNSFEFIKEQTHIAMDRYKEQASSYARVKSEQILFPNSITSHPLYGTHEELDAVLLEDLYEEYQQMLQNSLCEILIIGDLDMDLVVNKIKNLFYKPSIVMKDIPKEILNKKRKYQVIEEESHYEQSQVIMLYQLGKITEYERCYVYPLFKRIWCSSGMKDKLNSYLRKEESLCYGVSAGLQLGDNYGIVQVGLKKENVKKAIKCIKKALKEIQDGKIEEEVFASHKEKLLSDVKLSEDSIYHVLLEYYHHEVFKTATKEEFMEEIPKITKKDIQKLAKKIKESLLYILKEQEDDERN